MALAAESLCRRKVAFLLIASMNELRALMSYVQMITCHRIAMLIHLRASCYPYRIRPLPWQITSRASAALADGDA